MKESEGSILLVDDEQSFSRQTSAWLQSEGFTVHCEADGHKVLAAVSSLEPDILLLDLDLGLPDIDGRAVCAQVTKTESYQFGELGVILITGRYIDQSDELTGYNIGADNYLIKPFNLPQLTAKIRALLRVMKRRECQTVYANGDFSLDYKRYEVRVCGNLIALARLEYRVLEYLVKAEGAVCLKSDLLEHVWGTMHIEEGAIAKCISLLRSKLQAQSTHQYIETVYGIGYKFSPECIDAT